MSLTLPTQLIRAIESGKAILFTGAGFSNECRNYNEKTPPRAKELAHEIAELGNFDKDDDLAYVTDRYLKQTQERTVIIDFLKNNYTLRSTTGAHRAICNLPWMRCYTTNYDNSIEVAGQEIGKRFETACVEKPPSEYQKKNLVVHINGSISELSQKTLETSFKLSESSYNSPEGFLQSPWFHNFKNDISRCSAIVFVGYSLYDIDIKRVIANQDDLNIYFITQENLSQKDKFIFSSYGEVIQCGVSFFGDLVSNIKFNIEKDRLNALEECTYSLKNIQVKDSDLEKLFVYGSINDELIEVSVVGDNKWQYFFRRSCLNDVEMNISKQHIIVTSELGNGKSAFLKELAPFLISKAHKVYIIGDAFGDIIADVEVLVNRGKHFVLLLDDYYRESDLLQHLAQNYNINDFTIVATSRTSFHYKEVANLKACGFEYIHFSLDLLDDEELEGIISIVTSMGQWGKLAGKSLDEKKNWIKYTNESSLMYFLLSLFDSEDIKNRIERNIKFIIDTPKTKDVVFALAILKAANLPATTSLVSEVSGNDEIYKSSLKNKHEFQDLFKQDRNGAVSISSVFAMYLLKSQFSSNEIKNRFLNIAEKFDKKQNHSRDHNLLFKHVLKFSSLERILKDDAKLKTMSSYYEDLKRKVHWITNDPHYWLQYGMAQLAHNNFDKARVLFSTAYSLASKKPGYYTDQIDTQQARLLLTEYIHSSDSDGNFGWFEDAHRLLANLDDDRYKFKQIDLYRVVIDAHFENLSRAKKNKMRQFCLSILDSAPKASSFGYREQDYIDRIVARLREVFDKRIIKGNAK